MKIILMGTPDFAVGTLRSLAEAGHEITLVVSQPDKPKGRGHAMVPTPVKAVAEELGIPVFQPVKIREAKDVLEKTEADVCVVAAFGQIKNMDASMCMLPCFRSTAEQHRSSGQSSMGRKSPV